MRTTFQSVYARGVKRGTCSRCGKMHVRRKTFEQTVNPWNTNPDGTTKSAEQVRASVNAEARAWEREPIDPCQPRESSHV